MSIPETLLAAVCLLVTCSGIAAMAEDWRDTASANRAAAEFTVTARRAAAWVLSRRTDLAEKAEHAPFSLTELCPETASARNSVTGQPYTAFLFTPETGQLSLALFAAGGSGDREMLRKIIRPAARRIEAGFFVAENGLLVRGNEKLSPASLCSGCGSLSSALPAGSWGTILTLPEGRAVSAVPADDLVSRLAVPGGEEARMDAALGMNGNAVTDLSALFFSGGNGESASAGDAAFRESCASGSGEGTLTFFSGSGLLLCRGKEAVALPDSLSSLLLRHASRPDISASASALRQASAAGTFPASGTGATGSVTCPQGMIPAVWSAAVLIQKKTSVRKNGEEVLGAPPAGYSGNAMRLRVCLHQGE